ncbi:MAG: DUF945 family protein [Pseudohongiellaceae bacterium]|nr:DUF945 family protein [Pseudohongiellaceae bacterium]
MSARKKFNLSFIGIVLVALVLTFVTPKVLGLIMAGSDPQRRLQELSGQSELELELESGWFQRSGTVVIKNPVYGGIRFEGHEFRADMKIHHGPLFLTPEGPRFGLARIELVPFALDPQINGIFQSLNINADTPLLAWLKTDGSLQIELPTRQIQSTDSFDFYGKATLFAQLKLVQDGSAELAFNMSDASISSNEVTIEGGNISLNSSSTNFAQPAFSGSATLEVNDLRITSLDSLTIDRISLDYIAFQEAEGQSYSAMHVLGVENIVATDAPVNNFTWQMELQNIDPQLANVYSRMTQLNSAVGVGQMANAQMQELRRLSEEAALIAVQNPINLQSSLSMDAYDGHHEAQLVIDWPGLPTVTQYAAMPFGEIIATLNATLNMESDAEAIIKTPFGITAQNYMQMGMLPVNQGKVTLNASLNDGTLNINEQVFPLRPFLDL